MLLTIDVEDLDTVEDHGTVLAVTGTDDQGNRVTFGGDRRPLGGLIEWVEENGATLIEVEGWQVLRTVRAA